LAGSPGYLLGHHVEEVLVMAVFVSYSSRDRALLDALLVALRRGREQVWFDEELTGGETWWRTILEQIRGCDLFVVALSKNMLDSKACQAELRYAQELGKPILPVQVGPLDNMRINPLAQMQVIDYRQPSIETGIELVSSVHARKAMSAPLPDPLPEEPPIPFAYLMRLASTISGPSLSAQQQLTLVAELKAGLEEDGDDLSARRDITQLLCMLRDRSDVTWRTRTEVEAVLASLETAPAAQAAESPASLSSAKTETVQTAGPRLAQAGPGPMPARSGPMPAKSGPMPARSGPMPAYSPPSPPPGYGLAGAGSGSAKPSKSGTKWLIGGGIAAAVIAVIAVVAVIALTGKDAKPTPPPPPPPTVAPTALNSLLLTADEVDSIMGTTTMDPGPVHNQMQSDALAISDPECAGAQYNALQTVYAGSGYSTVVDQALTSGKSSDPDYSWVGQTAVAFPSHDQASAFLRSSTQNWKLCAGKTVTVTIDEDEINWSFEKVAEQDSQIAQTETQEGMGGYACQHVMRAVSNVIVEAAACSDHISDEANRIAENMAGKAPT
jgi:hypothetical protein